MSHICRYNEPIINSLFHALVMYNELERLGIRGASNMDRMWHLSYKELLTWTWFPFVPILAHWLPLRWWYCLQQILSSYWENYVKGLNKKIVQQDGLVNRPEWQFYPKRKSWLKSWVQTYLTIYLIISLLNVGLSPHPISGLTKLINSFKLGYFFKFDWRQDTCCNHCLFSIMLLPTRPKLWCFGKSWGKYFCVENTHMDWMPRFMELNLCFCLVVSFS